MSDEKNPLPEQALAPTPAPAAATAPVADLNLTVDAGAIIGMLKTLMACGDRYAAINGQKRTEDTPKEQRQVWISCLMAVLEMGREIKFPRSAAAPYEHVMCPGAVAAPLEHLMYALEDIDNRGVTVSRLQNDPAALPGGPFVTLGSARVPRAGDGNQMPAWRQTATGRA